MKSRGNFKAFAFAAALAAGAFMAPAASAEPFRVCADPDNLPFSKAEGGERGMYIELAELVAGKLNQPIEYTWWDTSFQRRALRNTILQGSCDAVFALPANADYKVRGLQRTKPFMQVSYAVVAAPEFTLRNIDDLKGRRLGVQFSTTPHILLSTLDGFTSTTYRSADELLQALAKGEVDTAFMWGPVAGYENKKRYANRWRVTPVAGLNLDGAVAVAVRRGMDKLAADVDSALLALKPQIDALADKYGFPREAPVRLGDALASVAPSFAAIVPVSGVVAVADADPTKPPPRPASKPTPPKAVKPAAKAAPAAGVSSVTSMAAAPALSEAAAAGRVMFNDKCGHCHGTDGFSPVRERDVRYLKARYNDKWIDTATITIKNGRPDAGMPIWKEILKEPELQQIMSFLTTIQK
jgi:polar amino acid transport system substrate-binding protein